MILSEPHTFDAAHYAMASALAAMAVAWWRHAQSLAASRDKETAARVKMGAVLDTLADEMKEVRQTLVKIAERSPVVGEGTERGLRRPE